MLTRIRLPAKLPCHVYNLWLVSCPFLLSRQLLSNIFCLSSSMKFGPEGETDWILMRWLIRAKQIFLRHNWKGSAYWLLHHTKKRFIFTFTGSINWAVLMVFFILQQLLTQFSWCHYHNNLAWVCHFGSQCLLVMQCRA